jgi:hypothetical protein
VSRELVLLLALVLAVDGLFIAGYFLFRLAAAGHPTKIGYTAAWTILTLVVVLRSLSRIRALRGRGGSLR